MYIYIYIYCLNVLVTAAFTAASRRRRKQYIISRNEFENRKENEYCLNNTVYRT